MRPPPADGAPPRNRAAGPHGNLRRVPSGSVFDAILSGALPSYCVYQDERVYAFLDIQPLARGHTLVIPRERAAQLHELSEESAAALGRALPRICRAVLAASGASAYNVLQNNGAAAHQAV